MSTNDNRVGCHSLFFSKMIEHSQIGDNSLLVALERYWSDLLGERRMPSPCEFDPLEIGARLIPWICLLDVIKNGVPRD